MVLATPRTDWAQDPAAAAETPPALAAEPKPDARPSTTTDAPNHSLSADTSARVVAGLPKFTPAKPTAVGEESPDLRETDKPRNGIIRLPRYQVREKKAPDFKNREMLTPEGKIELAFKRRPGLKIGNIFGLNRGIAMAMLAEDEAYERRLEMEELSSFTAWMDQNYPMDPKTGRRTGQSETQNGQK